MKFLQNFGLGFALISFKTSCIASHLHYNNIFMHYRCMLYMLICCVLLGLDWAEPMIFFWNVTCSCIFLHTYLHLFIFLYIDVFGDFLRVSLSPSLFLSVSCIMSPKRKSTSSQNPLRSGVYSFSNPTPFHVWFIDDKA